MANKRKNQQVVGERRHYLTETLASLGLSLTAAAELCGVSRRSMQYYAAGRVCVPAHVLARLGSFAAASDLATAVKALPIELCGREEGDK